MLQKRSIGFVRVMALAVVLIMLAGTLAGCGTKATDKDEQGRTVLSVGGWPSKEGTALDATNARKDRFESANPDVAINPDMWVFDRKTFYAKAAGGQLPNVYEAGFTEMAEIINSGYSADLTDVLKKRGYEGMFNENIMDAISKDGKILAFPYSCHVLGIAYNTKMFEAAGLMNEDGTPQQPKTWDELAEFAVKIKEATGKPGVVFPTANNVGGWLFSPVAWSYGVDFMEKDADGKWKATFDTPEAAAALQYIKDLKWKYDVLPANTIIDHTELFKIYGTGGAAMVISAGDVPGKVAKYNMNPDDIGVMGIPAGPKRHVTLLGGSVYCVSADATEDQIDAAIRWLETAFSYKLQDDYKATSEATMEVYKKENRLIGIKNLSPWSTKAETLAWDHALIDANRNANENHYKPYNDFVADCPAEIQPEEPICGQELYSVIDGCIQEVLTNKDADCAALMKKANADFQSNYLDNLSY